MSGIYNNVVPVTGTVTIDGVTTKQDFNMTEQYIQPTVESQKELDEVNKHFLKDVKKVQITSIVSVIILLIMSILVIRYLSSRSK